MRDNQGSAPRVRTIILGAAGRDFHDFNTVFRSDPATDVVAFTAAQIPGIAGRRYPPELAGPLYPEGIRIEHESRLEELMAETAATRVVFAYSDVTHEEVMHLASRALAGGADFVLLGPQATMVDVGVPVIAVSAVRTGCGKSQVARMLSGHLRRRGLRVSVVRHPMPYGELALQQVQRLATRDDLASAGCTIEEREEYEPHIESGAVVFAGVDYTRVLPMAAAECDVLLWDGGNNDFPFVRPGLHVVVVDALRPGHAERYHPGEATLRMADVVVLNKVNSASAEQMEQARDEIRRLAPGAGLVLADSTVRLEDPAAVRGRATLVVEDGPTLTHGGMPTGAGYAAAIAAGALRIVDPRESARGSVAELYARYPHIGPVLPAAGYSAEEIDDLAATINASAADVVVNGSPADITALARFRLPVIRARYDYGDAGDPLLTALVDAFLSSPRVSIQ